MRGGKVIVVGGRLVVIQANTSIPAATRLSAAPVPAILPQTVAGEIAVPAALEP